MSKIFAGMSEKEKEIMKYAGKTEKDMTGFSLQHLRELGKSPAAGPYVKGSMRKPEAKVYYARQIIKKANILKEINDEYLKRIEEERSVQSSDVTGGYVSTRRATSSGKGLSGSKRSKKIIRSRKTRSRKTRKTRKTRRIRRSRR
jgi:hypothetical protein